MEASAMLIKIITNEPLDSVYEPEDELEEIELKREIYFWEGKGMVLAEYDARIKLNISHFRSPLQ